MKRVFCLLLCLTLLCGLLPTAVLADNGEPLYFELCGADGTATGTRVKSFDASFGETYYFRVYTAETEGTQITGGGLSLSEAKTGELKWVSLSETDGYYIWNTRLATADMPLFKATVTGTDYETRVFVHSSDVGWFSSETKSLSTALTLADKTEADVQYDGKTSVTVYLTAEFSFVTEIGDIQKSDEGIKTETFNRGSDSDDRGHGLTVTCPAGLSGEPWVEVKVQQKFVNDPDTAYKTVTYKVTFSADGVSVNAPSAGRPGEPVLLPGVTNASGDQVYFGIGLQTDSRDYTVATSSRFTGPSTEQTTETFKPCFFVKSTEGYTETAVDTTKFSISELSMQTPTRGNDTASDDAWKTNADGTYSLTLTSDMVGTWTITASCTVGETTYSVSCYSERVNARQEVISNVESVSALNEALKTKIEGNTEGVDKPLYIFVNLDAKEYEGTIEIPEETKGRVIVILQGNSDGPYNRTILKGGIDSNCDTVSVENIDFRGANYQEDDTKYTENYSATCSDGTTPNYALYGSGRGNSVNCTFEGYKQAVVWTVGSRLLGRNNIYRYNDIGWYVDIADSYDNGINTDATGSRFEHNNTAIYVKSFGGFQYTNTFAVYVRGNVFIDNDLDVNNRSGRWWYIPGNYFEHENEAGPDSRNRGESGTSFYPMAQYDSSKKEIVQNGYSYDQLNTTDGDRLSNSLTNSYQIPEESLNGKTYRVCDDGTDEVLATFSFPETQTSTQAIALFAAREAEPEGFDATVDVNRSNADSIVFTMQSPLKKVTVKLPCTFTSGTVTHNNVEIEGAVFNGTNVSFDTTHGGTYVITKTGAEPAIPGASGSLIAGIAAAGSGSGLGASASQFSDLTAGSWYYEAVRSALKNGLMNGTSAHTFSPDAPMTRAMLVTILWRMAGQPSAKTSPFTDVVSGSWYAQAVHWAYDRGIVTGVSETAFAPNEPVTREALVTILYRYASLKQNLPAADDQTSRFADGRQVSAFAREAVNWALQTGLLTGVRKTTLSAKGLATRAQIAVLIERFLKQ